jgi:hypothetical protein
LAATLVRKRIISWSVIILEVWGATPSTTTSIVATTIATTTTTTAIINPRHIADLPWTVVDAAHQWMGNLDRRSAR